MAKATPSDEKICIVITESIANNPKCRWSKGMVVGTTEAELASRGVEKKCYRLATLADAVPANMRRFAQFQPA